MVLYQPDHQPRVPGGQLVAAAELLGVDGAQLGMVATAPLSDVVIQAGNVDEFRLG